MTNDWHDIQAKQRQLVLERPDESMKAGKKQLGQMRKMLVENEAAWLQALREDLGKSVFEGYATEFAVLMNELDYMDRYLKKWLKPKKMTRQKLDARSTRYMMHRPYGSILVISPWNYPLQLTLMPVIGALACGNRCFIKPSEHASATAHLLAELIPQYFSNEWLQVVNGDATIAKQLLSMKWDLIFFTGSPRVGREVHKQAAENGTPVVLELGGKNPCIMDRSGFSENAIERIVWGKFLNGGQTCVAPDTLYVAEAIYPEVLKKLKSTIIRFYGVHPEESPDYGRMVHANHAARLEKLMEGGQVYYGGQVSAEERYVSPTILTNINEDSTIMQEEIFGPILPVIPYKELSKVIESLPDREPLAAYVFSNSKRTVRYTADKIRTRALGVNETITHVADSQLPFGGIGESGMGTYHGHASIETFSYEQLINEEQYFLKLKQKYPPYETKNMKIVEKLRRWLI